MDIDSADLIERHGRVISRATRLAFYPLVVAGGEGSTEVRTPLSLQETQAVQKAKTTVEPNCTQSLKRIGTQSRSIGPSSGRSTISGDPINAMRLRAASTAWIIRSPRASIGRA